MSRTTPTGQSRAPITAQDGWHSYTGDHVGLLDHLRIDRCHLYGQCIGGSFILSLLEAQPIGHVGAMPAGRSARFEAWAESLEDHPEASPPVLDAFYRNLYEPGFVYCVDRRRGAPVADLRGADETAPELRVHPGVEDRRVPDVGERARQGVPVEAHAPSIGGIAGRL